MCISPVSIENPHYRSTNSVISSYYDVDSRYILVPCGKCSECRHLRQSYWLQRVQLQSLTHYVFMGTLTYCNEMLPRIDVDGSTFYYADMRDFRLMIKRLRRRNFLPPGTKYLVVSEYGGRNHRPHFHFLLFLPKKTFKIQYYDNSIRDFIFSLSDIYSLNNLENILFKTILSNWCRRVSGSRKYSDMVPLCHYVRRGRFSNYDFHFVGPRMSGKQSDVSFYVTKYLLSYDKWFRKLLYDIFNKYDVETAHQLYLKLRPRVLSSRDLGVSDVARDYVLSHLLNKAENSLSDMSFVDVETGKTMPLSPYLRKKFVSGDVSIDFYTRKMLHYGFDPFASISTFRDFLHSHDSTRCEHDTYVKKSSLFKNVDEKLFHRFSCEESLDVDI